MFGGFLVFVFLCCVFVNVFCFNLDTVDYVLHQGEKDSMFGFSVASHWTNNYSWVLIGAPEAQTHQPSVTKGGAVYLCPVDRDTGDSRDSCRELHFDRKGNNNNSNGHQIDEKSGQWFGATVNSGGPNKPIVACAPRYLWYTTKVDRRDPVGTCYVSASDFSSFSEFSPCRTRHWGYHRQGTCQAGLGAAISKNGERLFVGAPGSWYWQGQVYSIYSNATFPYATPPKKQFGEGQMYSINPEARFPFTPPRYSDYGAGQLYSQNLRERPSVFFTQEGQPLDDDSYMGYSVTAGNFTGDEDGGLAAGMPRGNRLVGKVLLYTWNLTNHQNISGSQLGAYFGYAIAAADMNGDGLDELIVGAPLHTEPNNEGKYEVGRLYVFSPVRVEDDPNASSGAKYPKMRKYFTRDGINSKGRFGLSVACLGDLDLDGYQDIAVGAPYDGPQGRGAVYIYYGSKVGIREKPSQIIHSEDVPQLRSAAYTFGFSVSGGIDLDRNQYPDLIVGAYESNTAFVIRSRPVINVEGYVSFNAHKKQISLEEKNCSLSIDKYVSCTSLKACVKYNGVGVSNGIELIIEFILDAKKQKDSRMFQYPSDRKSRFNETWHLRRNEYNCKEMQVYIKESTRDKLTPLEVEMKYSLHQREKRNILYYPRDPRRELLPVVNGNLPSTFKDSIVIRKNCGSDDVCIPDLHLVITPNVEKYLLGSGKQLKIDVKVMNHGEDSFESMFYMKVPPGINYFNTEHITGPTVKCSAPSEATNNTLKCDIGNPLPAAKIVHFRVLLDPFKVEGMKASYDFSMKINSTNPEDNSTIKDNIKDLSVEIWVKTNISLTGWAQYPDIHYKEDAYKEDNYTIETDIGPQIVHIYSIKNNGPSDINEAEVIFLWPNQTLAGDDMLYLMEQPEVSGKISCEFVPIANPLKVELISKKYYLETPDSKKLTGNVKYEEKSTSFENVGVTTSHKHDQKKIEREDKIAMGGDGSHVHINRGKESSRNERTQGGGSVLTKEEKTYNWTSSSVNSGPVQTWSRNTSRVTGQDGVTHFSESTSGNQDQNINNYKIVYTSTGNQQGNRFEGNNQKDKDFSISQQSNIDRQSKQFGTVHHTVSPTDSKKQTGYFNWDDDNTSRDTSNVYGSVQTHKTSEEELGISGHINDNGEMIYGHQQRRPSSRDQISSSTSTGRSGSVYREFKRFSGYNLTGLISEEDLRRMIDTGNGEFYNGTHRIRWTAHHRQQPHSSRGESVYKEFQRISGYDLNGLINEEDLRHMIDRGSGEFNNGTHRIKWIKRQGGFNMFIQGEDVHGSQGESESIYREFQRISGYDLRGIMGEEALRQMMASGSGEFHNGTHRIRWTAHHMQEPHSSRGESVYREFQRISGYDLNGLINEEDLRHMIDRGSGEFNNGTHRIKWIKRQGGFNMFVQGEDVHGSQGESGSIYREFQRVSGYDLRGIMGEEALRRMMESGSGEFHNGTHRIKWTTKYGGFSSFNEDESRRGSAYLEFRRISGYDLTGLVNEEDLRRMIERGSGEFYNGTQKIKWTTRNGGFRLESDGSNYRPYTISTEESINQNLDEYTKKITQQGGRDRATYGQYDQSNYGTSSGLEGAALGGGFRTTGLDLGVLPSSKQPNERDYGSTYYDPDLGSYEDRSSETHSQAGVSYGTSRTYNSGGRHTVPTDRTYRTKRQADEDDSLSKLITCNSTKCYTMKCKSGPLVKDEEAWVALRFRANAATLKKVGWTQVVTVSSMMASRINKLPYIGTPLDRPIHTHEVFTNVTLTETEIKPDVVPLWVVVLSACAGTIILLLLIFLLYKCGFFKRNRPSDAPERQPLNRNGHYQGDEQL